MANSIRFCMKHRTAGFKPCPDGFHKYVQQARRNSVVSEERARKSIREHKQILRAIRDNDADLAEQLANEHILHVMQNLKKQGYEENLGGYGTWKN